MNKSNREIRKMTKILQMQFYILASWFDSGFEITVRRYRGISSSSDYVVEEGIHLLNGHS